MLEETQHDRYLRLREQVQQRYENIRQFAKEEQLSDFWVSGAWRAEKLLLPHPDFDFMGKPGLRGRMGTNPAKYNLVKTWLEDNFDQRLTKAALVVDQFGGVPQTNLLGKTVNWDVTKFLFYAYVAAKETGVPIRQTKSILDWGSGYGGQPKIYKRMGHDSLTYTIADFPPVCVLQWLYLSVLFGEDAVNLITVEGKEAEKGKINIIPSSLVLRMSNEALGNPELFISTNALNECPAEVVRTVVEDRDWFGATRLLIRMSGKPIPPKEGNLEDSYDLLAAVTSFGGKQAVKRIDFDSNILIGSR
ncbi:hypothetical protein LCGC14_0275370 [marine sediment metagenome]|uniref:Sugar O-methyltransferase n=1 Tax=marine sediment metagenome TaxID=412755 RepID=A0A0F9UED4_9ZZZZ